MSPYKNVVLDALSAADPEFVRERAQPVSFAHEDVLAEAGKPIEHLYFPQSGVISVAVDLNCGDRIEAAMIGCDGVVGASAACGAEFAISTAFVQIAGQGWRMAAADVAALAEKSRTVYLLLVRHEQFMLAQAQQMAACNARHHIPARLCSWLMRAQDLSAQNDMLVTQEFLARTLGVQRASISLIAGALQEAGLIQYRRGRVAIVDKDALADKACECYQALRTQRRRLFHIDRINAVA
jgi:CRP-like cAMP-binding protein